MDRIEDADQGTPVGRRLFLGLIGLGAAGVAFGASVKSSLSDLTSGLPGANYLPSANRFRIYTVAGYPRKTEAEYRLRIAGLVDRPTTLSFADLLEREPTHMTKDFQCVTGWRVEDVEWSGVKLADLLDEVGVQANATAVKFTSFDGVYTESLTLEQARRDDVIVAYRMLDADITRLHGGPVRLYVAPMYGYKSIKWLDGIELTAEVEPGYWEARGYDVDAWIGQSNGRNDEPV